MWINGSLPAHKEIKTFDIVDLAKFIGAFFMVAGHTNPLSCISETANYVFVRYFAQIVVRFFFVTSGFLLFRRVDEKSPDLGYTVRYALKILKLYVLWTALYLPIICYSVMIHPGGWIEGLKEQILQFLFVGSATQLWYLNALIYSVLLITLLLYLKADKTLIFAISAVFALIGWLGSDNWFSLNLLPESSTVRTVLWAILDFEALPSLALKKGFFYVSLGMLLAWCDFDIPKKKAYPLTGVFALVFFAEGMIPYLRGYRSTDGSFLTAAPVVFMFCYILLKTAVPHREKYVWYRNMSSLIFYVHIFVLTFFGKILEFIDAAAGTGLNNGMVRFIGTSLISFAFSAIVLKLSEKEKYSFLKVLYTGSWKKPKKRKET